MTLGMLVIVLLAYPTSKALAQTPIATSTATPKAAVNAQLEELKDRLATKVAELRDIVRRAVTGTVKTVSISSATVETKTKDIKIELGDDIVVTQVINGKRTPLTIEDLAKDDRVTVFGSYDATLDLLKARVIFIESSRVVERITGTVTDVDQKAFTITVQTLGGTTVIVDIEKATKTVVWTKTDGVAKGGFSKILTGDTVHVTGTAVPKEENRLSALRILDIGNLSSAQTPTATIAPTPVASDAATPKVTVKPTTKPTSKPTATP